MFVFENYKLRKLSFPLILLVGALAVVGLAAIYSATLSDESSGTADKQILGIGIGVVAMLFFTVFNYRWLKKYVWFVALFNILLMAAVLVIGTDAGTGATRWLTVPGLGNIQPAELSKLLIILFFSYFFDIYNEYISKPWFIGLSVVIMGIFCALIFLQPDLSTTIVCAFCFIVLIFVAGISYKYVIGALAIGIPGAFISLKLIESGHFPFLHEYQANRILSWLYPDKYGADLTTQQSNSMMAIGSGGLNGKGLFYQGLDSVKAGNFLSEEDTDFIWAVVGEEVGFVGCCFIILLFILLVVECFLIASKARDLSGKLICCGVGSWFAFQAFVNIGVATGMLPNTGLPLPFISAGLSSLVSNFCAIGIVLNISMQRRDRLLEESDN